MCYVGNQVQGSVHSTRITLQTGESIDHSTQLVMWPVAVTLKY